MDMYIRFSCPGIHPKKDSKHWTKHQALVIKHVDSQLVSSYSNSQLHTPTTNSAPRRSLPSFIEPKCQNFSFVRHIHHHLHYYTKAREILIKRSQVSFFESFLTQGKNVEILKQELLKAISPLDRGAEATPEDQERIDQIASKIEALNKVKEPLKSDLLNGKWELLYTTSQSILQSQRPKILRPNGKIYQAINTDTLRAQNMETWPFFNQATANLVPQNEKRVAVKFDKFKIAGVVDTNKITWKWSWSIGNYVLG